MACKCQGCGEDYAVDMNIQDDLWVKISPKRSLGGLLCPDCICKRLVELGMPAVECEVKYKGEAVSQLNPTKGMLNGRAVEFYHYQRPTDQQHFSGWWYVDDHTKLTIREMGEIKHDPLATLTLECSPYDSGDRGRLLAAAHEARLSGTKFTIESVVLNVEKQAVVVTLREDW